MAPALAAWQDELWLAFVANNTTNQLLICNSANGSTWSPATAVPNQSTKATPALTAWQNKLWLAFVANNTTNQLLICNSANGNTWSPATAVPNQSTKMTPALAGLNAGMP
jgi:hypothetical protein